MECLYMDTTNGRGWTPPFMDTNDQKDIEALQITVDRATVKEYITRVDLFKLLPYFSAMITQNGR